MLLGVTLNCCKHTSWGIPNKFSVLIHFLIEIKKVLIKFFILILKKAALSPVTRK